MKNKRKITIAIFFMICIMAIQVVPVTGTNSVVGFTLTLEQAANLAIQNSRELRTSRENADLATTQVNQLRGNIVGGTTVTEMVNSQLAAMNATANRARYLQSIESQRDTLHFVAANNFTTILTAENELLIKEFELMLLEQELEILRTRINLGMASQLEYNMERLNVESVRYNKQRLEQALANAHVELNRLMGVSLNRVHQLIFEVEYEELHVLNFNGHINHHRQNHALVREARAATDAEHIRVNNYHTAFNPETGEVIPGQASRNELIMNLNIASRRVIDAQDSVQNHITGTYHKIRQHEQTIASSIIRLEDLHNQLEILRARLAVGEITSIEIERHNLEIKRLEETIRKTKAEHKLLVMQFSNPNIAF